MEKKKTKRQQIHRIVVNALREVIQLHGPIHPKLIGSVAKRIVGPLLARKEKKNECISSNTKR